MAGSGVIPATVMVGVDEVDRRNIGQMWVEDNDIQHGCHVLGVYLGTSATGLAVLCLLHHGLMVVERQRDGGDG